MSEAEETVAAAVEDVAAAQAANAESNARVADSIVHTETAQAAQVVVAAAEAATALASTTAAAAQQQAAVTINENQGEVEWLRQHATQTENSLSAIQQNQARMAEVITPMQEAMGNLMTALQSLTLPNSQAEPGAPGVQVVNPVQESAGEADPKAVTQQANQRGLKTRKWI